MMRYLVFYAVDMAIWSAALVPALAIVGYFRGVKYSLAQRLWILVLALYLAGVYNVAGGPELPYIAPDFNMNLIPIIDIFNDPWAYLLTSVLNVIMFIPMGFILPLLWKGFRSVKRICITGFAMSLIIELAQLLNHRISDVDDLITNTLGAFLGYCILMAINKRRPILLHGAGKGIRQLMVVAAVVILIMFVLRPYVTMTVYSLMFG